MKVKKEYVILLLIIIALSAYLLMRSSDRTRYRLPEIAELNPDKITKIEISKKDNAITLNKRDNRWYLEPEGYPADTDKVNRMLDVFESLSLTALISESEDYQRYDLHPAKRITAKAWQQDALKRNFDIGKTAPSFRHTFVKLGNDSRVFHASDSFRSKFEQSEDSLRDREVLSFKIGDIQAVQIRKDQASIELVRTAAPLKPAAAQPEKQDAAPPKQEWQTRDGKKADDQNLNRWLTALGSLKCDKYIDDRTKDSFSEPIYSAELKGIQDYRLDIYARLQKDDPNYPAVSSGSDYPFLLAESQAQQIMINPAEMLAEPESDAKTSEPSEPGQ